MGADKRWCCYEGCVQDAIVTMYAEQGTIDDYSDSCADHVEELKKHVDLGYGVTVYRLGTSSD